MGKIYVYFDELLSHLVLYPQKKSEEEINEECDLTK